MKIRRRSQVVLDEVKDDGGLELKKQLECIIKVRENRKNRLELAMVELRRNVSQKEEELKAKIISAEKFEENTLNEISSMRQGLIQTACSVSEIKSLMKKESYKKKQVGEQFSQCDKVSAEKNQAEHTLQKHMNKYRAAVIDVERASTIQGDL